MTEPKERGHPCQLRFWNHAWPNGDHWEVDCISHLSIEEKSVAACKVEHGRAFTDSELAERDREIAREAFYEGARLVANTVELPCDTELDEWWAQRGQK